MARILLPLTAVASALPAALAWGEMGHETIGYIAQNFVKSTTETYFKSLLGETGSDYLATVAPWADTYRYTTAGEFSQPFHFIDAEDSPPSSCCVELERDCPDDNCVVTAIANYTTRMLDSSLSKSDRQLAAKMVIHFVGDVGQPLHCENLDYGGNDIDVTYDGDSTNLHAIWDTNMPEEISGGSSESDAESWATTLTSQIQSGSYASAAGWVSGFSVSNTSEIESIALGWAQEANAYVCSTVLAQGISYVEDNDLSGSYFTSCTPVIEEQIAKQGYRLAKWLDLIADTASS